MNINRRSFLIGSAAAFAAASVPLMATSDIALAQSPKGFPYKGLVDITFSTDWPSDAQHEAVQFELMRRSAAGESAPLLAWAVHPLATVRWMATSAERELIFQEGHLIAINVSPLCAKAHLNLIYYVDPPNGGVDEYVDWPEEHSTKRRRMVSETCSWVGGELGDSQIAVLHLGDESLLA